MLIYKYHIEPGITSITLPKGAKFLDVQIQRGEPQAWFLFDEMEKEKETRAFALVGTGERFSFHGQGKPNHVYLGTFQLVEFNLVFHLFELL